MIVPAGARPARVLGFVASVQRRRIFVNAARIGSIDPTGVRMRSGTIDVLAFRQRPGEQLVVGDVFGREVGADAIIDVAIELDRETALVLRRVGRPRRPRPAVAPPRPPDRARGARSPRLFDSNPDLAEVAELRQMHAADVAERIAALPAAPAPQAGRAHGGRPAGRPARGAARGGAGPHHRGPRPRSGPPTSSRRWSPTTPPTCSARWTRAIASGCSRPWSPRSPGRCASSSPTTTTPPAAS